MAGQVPPFRTAFAGSCGTVNSHRRIPVSLYIHISPVNRKVLLLATWLKDEESAEIKASHQAAEPLPYGSYEAA